MSRLVDWIIGREPVAAATGIAAVITAALGVAAAFGAPITETQIAAVGALAAAVAGWAARPAVTPTRKLSHPAGTLHGEAGSVPLAMIILLALFVVVVGGMAFCSDALFEDEDEVNDVGLPALILDHDERDRCYGYECREGGSGDEGEYRDDNRRAGISPGPFDRSPVDFRDNRVTVCFPFARCDSEADRDPAPPA